MPIVYHLTSYHNFNSYCTGKVMKHNTHSIEVCNCISCIKLYRDEFLSTNKYKPHYILELIDKKIKKDLEKQMKDILE
jgi:hypothetical protein